MYVRFMSCELMKDVVEERLEIPYRGQSGEDAEEGQIDRLVKKSDGLWILIDYKTGAPKDDKILRIRNPSIVAKSMLTLGRRRRSLVNALGPIYISPIMEKSLRCELRRPGPSRHSYDVITHNLVIRS